MMSEEEILEEIERFGDSDRYERFVKTCIRKDDEVREEEDINKKISSCYSSIPFNLLEAMILKRDRFFLRTVRKKFHAEHTDYLRLLIYMLYVSQQDDPFLTAEVGNRCYRLYDKIITCFENFDECNKIKFPDIGVYERINEMGWEKDARKLRDRFCKKRDNVTQINYGMELGDEYGNIAYVWELEKGVDYIAAFRASRDLRTEIIREDVLSAWSTYIKLIYSDLDEISLPREFTKQEVIDYLRPFGEIEGIKPIDLFWKMEKDNQRLRGER